MKILDKYIELIEEGYCSDCNELNCIDNFPQEKIVQEIKQLQQENQQLKKQKDDVVEYIKKYLHEHVIDDLPDEESKFEKEGGIPIPNAKEILLRMLGEIE